eukprot:TRINITY_DN1324_c0_g1_i3.p1 TRINITY_DN1324_c0_g1~~TRINITY_DN1324_c0_g1_i3.p1  ORF type:complete len:327 (-),score=91.82 TRINITY_DN1324_c0_g1_i3:551-1531(-)
MCFILLLGIMFLGDFSSNSSRESTGWVVVAIITLALVIIILGLIAEAIQFYRGLDAVIPRRAKELVAIRKKMCQLYPCFINDEYAVATKQYFLRSKFDELELHLAFLQTLRLKSMGIEKVFATCEKELQSRDLEQKDSATNVGGVTTAEECDCHDEGSVVVVEESPRSSVDNETVSIDATVDEGDMNVSEAGGLERGKEKDVKETMERNADCETRDEEEQVDLQSRDLVFVDGAWMNVKEFLQQTVVFNNAFKQLLLEFLTAAERRELRRFQHFTELLDTKVVKPLKNTKDEHTKMWFWCVGVEMFSSLCSVFSIISNAYCFTRWN